MSEKDGGPAFPPRFVNMPGMTLRDYFASQALVGMGTWAPNDALGISRGMTSAEAHKNRAEWAYTQADAMLEARKR